TLANANYTITFVPAKLSIVDTTAPVITITNPDTTTATSKTITATTSDGTLTMSITTGNTCDGSLTFIAYAPITFNSESDNGKKVCYKAVDAYNNTRYSLSNAIAGISIPSVSTYSGGTPISFCSNYVYSEWGTCVNGIQTRTIISKDGGSSCSTSNATLSQPCITQPVVVNPVTPVTPVIPIISEPTKPVVTTPPVISEKTTIYSPKAVQLKTLNVKEDKKLETSVTNTYLNKNIDVKVYGKEAQTRILNFIVYGTQNNKYLSYQDRINVINDLKKTLGRAPTDEVEWTLAINAANDLEDEQLKIKEQKAIKLNKEKIPGPSKIKLYKNIEQIGSDLWGNKK
ncbi:MAG TPA: hypothetical protein PLM63_02035, partial [bacterium]|nr:hypothetical protein [bacterium]